MPDPVTTGASSPRTQHIEPLVAPASLLAVHPVTAPVARLVSETRASIHGILTGTDSRRLIVMGPCSIHDSNAALEYARWMGQMQERHRDRLLLVMRVYVEKPRTRIGWKGLINDPALDGTFRINEGLAAARRLMLEINMLGVPVATEFVDVLTPPYFADLVSWSAIGARTVESQLHRQMASGLDCPVGFKNSTDGNVQLAVDALVAAQNPHHFVSVTLEGHPAVVSTTGNEDTHIILRGGIRPNYDAASVHAAAELLGRHGLPERLMVDCGHGNSPDGQLVAATDVARQLREGSTQIAGIMIESNLVPGRQQYRPGQPLVAGQSITDPCISLEESEVLLEAFGKAD